MEVGLSKISLSVGTGPCAELLMLRVGHQRADPQLVCAGPARPAHAGFAVPALNSCTVFLTRSIQRIQGTWGVMDISWRAVLCALPWLFV